MSQLLIFWLITGMFFVIIEMFTVTLYGICVSIAAFTVALYVWITKDTEVNTIQTVIFAVVSAVLSYFLPKHFQKHSGTRSDNPIDMEAGKIFVLHESKGEYRINIEGANYLVNDSCVTNEFADGKKVILKSHTGSRVIVKIVAN
jgi:membrane protein implicated in regulation of membrane protease activity